MKVIDLLNKIANGEEVPKKIKVFGGIYYLCKGDSSKQLYFSEKQGYGGIGLKFNTSQINEEVEIIEKPFTKEIEELDKKHFHKKQRQLANKINEIIRKLKEMEK